MGVVDSAPNCGQRVADVPVLGTPGALPEWLANDGAPKGETVYGVVAFAGHQGHERLQAQKDFEAWGIRVSSCVDDRANLLGDVEIGSGCLLFAGSVVGPGVKLGQAVIVNQGASIGHDSTLGPGTHVANGAVVAGYVTVGENVLLGAGSVILPGVSIADDCVVGAGSVVTKSVDSGMTVVGNPARESRRAKT